MAYCFNFTNGDREFSIHRSRYTADWGLFEKNPHYGYWAARRYAGPRLTRDDVVDFAAAMGLDPETVVAAIEADVRTDVNPGLLPDPDFTFTNGGSI